MPLVSAFEIEIQDLGDTSGECHLMWVRTQGGSDGDVRSNVNLRHRTEANKAPAPLIVRYLGPSLGFTSINPHLGGEGRGPSGLYYNKFNNDWQSDPDYLKISGEGYALSNSDEAAFAQSVYEGAQRFYTHATAPLNPNGTSRARLDVIRATGVDFWPTSSSMSGSSGAWLSYNVSGETNKNIFAYTFEIVAELSGTGVQMPLTGQDYKASELLYLTGRSYSGACADVSLMLSVTGESCNYAEGFLDRIATPKFICVPNSLDTDTELSGYIRTGLLRASEELSGAGYKARQSDTSQLISTSDGFSYSVYQGNIAYNYPYSGDYIEVYPYSFDYSGAYNTAYGVNPPYPATTVTLTYLTDYSDIDSLVVSINTKLSGSGQTLWNRALDSQLCIGDFAASGMFETGALMKAEKSGTNNIIITSLRPGEVGKYQISFFEAARPSGIVSANKTKTLLPKNVYLEGSTNESSWTTLSSLTPNWKDAASMTVDLDSYSVSWATGNSSGTYTPAVPEPPTSNDTGAAPIRTIYSGQVSASSKCNELLTREVEFYKVERPFQCVNTGNDAGSDDEVDGFLTQSGVAGTATVTTNDANALVYKTGAKTSVTGDYNFYRLRFENLVSNQLGELSDPSDILYVTRVSFFGVKSGTNLLSGEACILGADYTGQVLGYTTGTLTGTITGQANESGLFNLSRYRVTGTPVAPLYFQRTEGTAVGAFTGLITASATGTGYYSDVVQGYYYNSGSDCAYFQAPVSGLISGSGRMTGGAYNLLNDSFVQSLSSNYQTVSGWENGSFTGVVLNTTYTASDIPSFYDYSSFATGNVGTGDSGYKDVSQQISFIPTGTVYSNLLSGTVEATALVAYNSPASGDSLVVNGVPFVFSSNSGSLYYSTASGLIEKINDNSSTNATGAVSGAYLFLRATDLGEGGNAITLSYTGGAGKPSGPSYFTGGRDVHYSLLANQEFTGYLDSGIYAVQYMQQTGSGTLTGQVKQLDFVRHFSGVWDIVSGGIDFRDSGKYTFGKYINSGFETLAVYSGRPDYIPLTLTYNNFPYVSTVDLVRLTVTGYDSQTGLSVILSGKVL